MADILILVKHAPTRKKLASLFENDQLQVLATSAPELGQALLHNAHFDLIIADTAMTTPSGLELITEASRAQPGVGIIAVTGSALTRSKNFKNYLHQLPAEHHFTLPFERKALIIAAHNMLATQRRRAPSYPAAPIAAAH